MHALLHTVGAVVVLPYVTLAMFFLFIGEAARARGLIALVDVTLYHADWLIRWGIFVMPLLWVCLVVMGFVPRLQRASSLCLCLPAVASFIVVVTLSSPRVGFGEIIFLLPCVAVAATSAWLFIRAGA
jgi:hypothetical protein